VKISGCFLTYQYVMDLLAAGILEIMTSKRLSQTGRQGKGERRRWMLLHILHYDSFTFLLQVVLSWRGLSSKLTWSMSIFRTSRSSRQHSRKWVWIR